jgi:DNA-binding winged helix-turn-helix (wHTH) protein/Tol biopolymer transport system component
LDLESRHGSRAPQVSKLKFGSFEFDPRRHELRRNGLPIKLAASQLRLLTLFLERGGELVTREQITARLWADTRNIDVSTGINTAVNRLRRHLQEAPEAPSAIETVIGLGYRFVPELSVESTAEDTAGPPDQPVPVEETVQAVKADTEVASVATAPEAQSHGDAGTSIPPLRELRTDSSTPQIPATRHRVSGHVAWIAGVAACILFLFAVAARTLLHWGANRSGAVSGASALALQATAARHIVRVTSERPVGEVTAAAVSPDGKIVAYSDRFGVSVHWFDSGVEHLLGIRPAFVVDRLAWLPDQGAVLMSGTDTEAHIQQVWSVPLLGAYLQPILQDANRAVLSPDGKRIAFMRGQDREIWMASSDGQQSNRVVTADPGDIFGLLLWSPSGDHLVLTEVSRPASPNSSGQTLDASTYLCVDAESGRVLDREGGVPAQSAYILADGELFFVQNDTPGPTTGEAKLMMVQTDKKSGRLLGMPRFIQKLTARHAQSLTASLTGERFAAVLDKAENDTFVASLHWPGPSLGEPVQVTKGAGQNFPHAWTADGSSVLLENNSLKTSGTGTKWAIFNVALSGSPPPKLVAQLPGNAAMEQLSPDGRWILFLQFEGRPQRASGIFRVPLEGGPPERVPTTGNLEEFHCSASLKGRCVLREAIDQDKLVYYALDPVNGMGEELARTPWEPNRLGDWGLSADGAFVSVAQHDTLHPGVEVISLKSHGAGIQHLPVQGHGTTLGANWSQDGKTLFVECRTEAGFELISLDLAGHAQLLRQSPSLIWAVTSRDNKKIAFPGLYQSTSLWASDVQPRL